MKFRFKKYAKYILEDRMEEVFCHFSKSNRKYAKFLNVLDSLKDKIIKRLGRDKILFYDYEETANHCKSLMLERIYLQGMIDGMRISKLYNQFSKGEF